MMTFFFFFRKVNHSFPMCAMIDGMGLYGHFLHYAIVISLVGSAFLIFLYLWRNKRLDIDEEPKFQMMRDEEEVKHDVRTKK